MKSHVNPMQSAHAAPRCAAHSKPREIHAEAQRCAAGRYVGCMAQVVGLGVVCSIRITGMGCGVRPCGMSVDWYGFCVKADQIKGDAIALASLRCTIQSLELPSAQPAS